MSHLPNRSLDWPRDLATLAQSFLIEEANAATRHDVRGKVASVRNGAFFIRRRLEEMPGVFAADPRLERFLQLIDDELDALGQLLLPRLPKASEVAASEIDLADLCRDLARSIALPAGVQLECQATGPCLVRANPDELRLALFCALENSVDAVESSTDKRVRFEVSKPTDATAAVAIVDSGIGLQTHPPAKVLESYFTTKANRLGLGLNIANRVASRWGGSLALCPAEVGARVELRFRGVPS